ncbi:MMPL family transporter [Oscillospiraceae bacterium CM]|nr:MMPL family transporter [Oscillospiraceae bacterium CM]
MKNIANAVIQHKKSVLIVFIVLTVLCAVFSLLVSVNYNMADYLPEDAQSTKAIEIMKSEFGGALPNARVMVRGVTVQEARAYKEKLASVDGVTSVTWLDDVIGSKTLSSVPLSFLDQALVEKYYKDATALFTVFIDSGREKRAVSAIREIIGDNGVVSGDAVNTAVTQKLSSSEVVKAMVILLPVILLILLLTTDSWAEPLLFLSAIGVAVVINMGTNVFFGEVSFITKAVSPILQLAVSLDYAIFLLHSFDTYRREHPPEAAMALAMKKAAKSVAASAGTTLVGFLALLFMRFGIGADLGFNLVKGVLLSFIAVMIFLPALTLISYKLLDKTRHKSFIPSFSPVGKLVTKISPVFLILAVTLAAPAFLAQSNIEFQYGMGSVSASTSAAADDAAIESVFGSDNTLVLLVPKSEAGKEALLDAALSDVPHVTGVISYAAAIGSEIPPSYPSAEITSQFYSDHYARVIINTDTKSEGSEAFATVKAILDTTGSFYPNGSFWLAGQSATLYDMRAVVSTDTMSVNIAAIVGIFLILLMTFRSPITPLLLVFTIESAIWLNLSFAYFSDLSFNFIGYLVISTVQLGATVDYAILMTDRYTTNRLTMPKKDAIRKTISDNLEVILISAVILSGTGFILAATSSNSIISQLGLLLGRGTVLSFLMVALVLPALLTLFDGAVQKTAFRFKKPRVNEN